MDHDARAAWRNRLRLGVVLTLVCLVLPAGLAWVLGGPIAALGIVLGTVTTVAGAVGAGGPAMRRALPALVLGVLAVIAPELTSWGELVVLAAFVTIGSGYGLLVVARAGLDPAPAPAASRRRAIEAAGALGATTAVAAALDWSSTPTAPPGSR